MNKKKALTTGIQMSVVILLVGCSSEEVLKPEIIGSIKQPVYKTIVPKVEIEPSVQNLQGRVIVVDAGHGGHDPGAGEVGYSAVPEKTINLAISKEVTRQLEALGAKVVMTRRGDYFVELDSRAAIAERNNADLLVSIHSDANRDTHIVGPTVYISRKASYQSRRLAESIDSSFSGAGIESNGIRSANFRVLTSHTRPAVLVECGFLTNKWDAERLNSNWYRVKIATVITDGISNVLGRN